jgi:hypothetical protein
MDTKSKAVEGGGVEEMNISPRLVSTLWRSQGHLHHVMHMAKIKSFGEVY